MSHDQPAQVDAAPWRSGFVLMVARTLPVSTRRFPIQPNLITSTSCRAGNREVGGCCRASRHRSPLPSDAGGDSRTDAKTLGELQRQLANRSDPAWLGVVRPGSLEILPIGFHEEDSTARFTPSAKGHHRTVVLPEPGSWHVRSQQPAPRHRLRLQRDIQPVDADDRHIRLGKGQAEAPAA